MSVLIQKFSFDRCAYKYIDLLFTLACRPVVNSNVLSQQSSEKAAPASRPLTTSQAYGQYAAASLQAKGLQNSSTGTTGTPQRIPVNSRAAGYTTSSTSDAPPGVRAATAIQPGSSAYPSYAPAPALVDAWSPPRPPGGGNLDLASASLWQPSKPDPIVEGARAWEPSSYTDPYHSQAALGYPSAQGAGVGGVSNSLGVPPAAGSSYSGSYLHDQLPARELVAEHSTTNTSLGVNGAGAGITVGSPTAKPGSTPYATERTLKVRDHLIMCGDARSGGHDVIKCWARCVAYAGHALAETGAR
jgi:hypothetical protein